MGRREEDGGELAGNVTCQKCKHWYISEYSMIVCREASGGERYTLGAYNVARAHTVASTLEWPPVPEWCPRKRAEGHPKDSPK